MSFRTTALVLAGIFMHVLFETNPAPANEPVQTKSDLNQVVREIARSPQLKHGEWSCTVIDVNSGEPLVVVNGDKSVAPASNLKLFTTAAALVILGAETRFKTDLGYTGELIGNTLRGDLVVRGGGDPAFASDQVKRNENFEQALDEIVQAVRKLDIRTISGAIKADISYFDPVQIPDGWLWVDIGNYYGAGPSALCVNDNLYRLYFRPGKNVGDAAQILYTVPEIPGITFINMMKTGPAGSGDHGYIYGGSAGFTRFLRGTIPAGVKRFSIKGSIPNPPLFLIQTLKQKLAEHGITVSGPPVVAREPVRLSKKIVTFLSPPLKELIYWINKKSINLYTEVLLKHLGREKYGEGSFEKGIKAIEEFLVSRAISTEGMELFDGSGLSPQDAITTMQMAALLKSMTSEPSFPDFFSSLPIAGVTDDDGQLGYLCRGTPAANNLRAKTGLINRVRAHSGYVKTKSGRLLCFSMIANDHTGSTAQIDRLHERVMIALANFNQ